MGFPEIQTRYSRNNMHVTVTVSGEISCRNV